MECWPVVSAVVENVATPALSGAVPKSVEPSLKATEPVGVPETLAVTVARNETDCPYTDELNEEATVVVVAPAGNGLFWLKLIIPPEAKQVSLAAPSTPPTSALTPKLSSMHFSSEACVKTVLVI